MFTQEHHLVAEIEFWRELIKHPAEHRSDAALERMHQALALAERKLLLLEPSQVSLPAMPLGSVAAQEH